LEIIGTQKGLDRAAKARLVKGKLGITFRHPDRDYRLSAREATDTGQSYTDRAPARRKRHHGQARYEDGV
jgi:hypothetical protein